MKLRLNKKVLKISTMIENDEKEYWQLKSPLERLRAVEINRRIVYGYGNTTPRFQRFFEVAQLEKNEYLFIPKNQNWLMKFAEKSLYIFDKKAAYIPLRVCAHLFGEKYFDLFRLGSHNQSWLLG